MAFAASSSSCELDMAAIFCLKNSPASLIAHMMKSRLSEDHVIFLLFRVENLSMSISFRRSTS